MPQDDLLYELPVDSPKKRFSLPSSGNNNGHEVQHFIIPPPSSRTTSDSSSIKTNMLPVPMLLQRARRKNRLIVGGLVGVVAILITALIAVIIVQKLSFKDEGTSKHDEKNIDFAISFEGSSSPKKHHFVLSKGFKMIKTSRSITLCIKFWRKRGSLKKSVLLEVIPIGQTSNNGTNTRFLTSLVIEDDALVFHWLNKSTKLHSGLPYERWVPVCLSKSDSNFVMFYHKVYFVDQNHEIQIKNVTGPGFENIAIPTSQVYAVIGSSVVGSTSDSFEGSIAHFFLFPQVVDKNKVMAFFRPGQFSSQETTKEIFVWSDFKGQALSPGSKEMQSFRGY